MQVGDDSNYCGGGELLESITCVFPEDNEHHPPEQQSVFGELYLMRLFHLCCVGSRKLEFGWTVAIMSSRERI